MTETKEEIKSPSINIEEMAKAGVHFGHVPSKTHPKMKPFIKGLKGGIYIINLEKTAEKLKEALDFIESIVKEGKTLLLVSTKIQMKDLVKEIAESCGLPYISERWLGGTITNFPVISKRIEYFRNLEEKFKAGEFEGYSKKERRKIEKELRKLEEKFGGIKNLTKLPDALLILDMKGGFLAVKEAKSKNIPVIAICDTNTDPSQVDFPIPGNDDAIPAVQYILERIKEVIIKAKP